MTTQEERYERNEKKMKRERNTSKKKISYYYITCGPTDATHSILLFLIFKNGHPALNALYYTLTLYCNIDYNY